MAFIIAAKQTKQEKMTYFWCCMYIF